MYRIKLVPILFILLFLAPYAGKTFHHHDDHQARHSNPVGTVIENICPVCHYELCAFETQIGQENPLSLPLQDLYLISNYHAPQSIGIDLPFLLRAPPAL